MSTELPISPRVEAVANQLIRPFFPGPETLYHYTTADGLLGIHKLGAVYATNLLYMNDSLELAHSAALVEILVSGRRDVMHLPAVLELNAKSDAYVVSFSANGDQLSQWRGYTSERAGFALGFDTASLKEIAHGQGFHLIRCTYDLEKQRELLGAFIADAEQAVRGIEGLSGDEHTRRMREINRDFYRNFLSVAPSMKHSSFHEEDEWRLVKYVHDASTVEHRSGRQTLIPYVPFQLVRNGHSAHVRRLMVGPTNHPELALKAATSFASRFCVKVRSVEPSIVPYRQL